MACPRRLHCLETDGFVPVDWGCAKGLGSGWRNQRRDTDLWKISRHSSVLGEVYFHHGLEKILSDQVRKHL